jgi:anti-sigma factor RsiW
MEYPPGWTCEVTVLRFEFYLLGTLTRLEALAVAEHLEACAACAQRLALITSTSRATGGGGHG